MLSHVTIRDPSFFRRERLYNRSLMFFFTSIYENRPTATFLKVHAISITIEIKRRADAKESVKKQSHIISIPSACHVREDAGGSLVRLKG